MKKIKKLEHKIYKLYEKVTSVCKTLNDNYEKEHRNHILEKWKYQFKHTKGKAFKSHFSDVMKIKNKYKNTKIYKLYMGENGEYSEDKNIIMKFKIEKIAEEAEIKLLDDKYHKTKSYINYIKIINELKNHFLKTKNVKDLKLCSFQKCKSDYVMIIKSFIKFIEDYNKTDSKEYKFLTNINLESISYKQYEIVTSMMNRFIKFELFSYVNNYHQN